jgi:hypothetical protein
MSSYEKMTGGIYQMNKTELIAAVAEKAELSKKDAEKAIKAFTDVVSASEDDTETLELFPEEVRAELKEYLGECGTMVLTLDVVEQVISWYEKSKDRRLCEIAFEAYDLFCRSLSVSYSAGTDFIQIADHSYWLYNPEENTGWEDMFPVSPVCDLCGIVLYVLGKAGGVC